MIFPTLQNKKFDHLNLNAEAVLWIAEKNFSHHDTNPLLDPVICQSMVADTHQKYSIDFSYGGWLEDRSFLWRGSYLEDSSAFIHLGVDLNVPAGTAVALDFTGTVVAIMNDYPLDGGWGTAVIVKHATEPLYFIYAHLGEDVLCGVGDTIQTNQIFASVGEAPFNGNWFPHVHVQCIDAEHYESLSEHEIFTVLDGYGVSDELHINTNRFPNPMHYISLT